jgi:DNA-binding NtrC family response regulator
MSDATLKYAHISVPLHVVKLEVIEGPDAGTSIRLRDARVGIGTAKDNQLVLKDRAVSRYHAELSGRNDGVYVVDLGSTNGTFADGIRLERALLPAGSVLKLGATVVRLLHVEPLVAPAAGADELCGIVGSSDAMRRLMYLIERAAKSAASALIVGESGTGKELVASALHQLSKRSHGPFVTVDCGSLAPTLVASALFGHERGAFTGAHKQRIGAFERADGGTLFLDEIGELPAELQASLLGALERRQIQRVGGDEPIAFDARVVCATHRDLREAVNKETFRLDLYYRLAVLKLHVPALRERREDISALCARFLRDAGELASIEDVLGDKALKTLAGHSFPGNVRELRNIVEASLVMGELPELEEFGNRSVDELLQSVRELSYGEARKHVLAAFERDYLVALMDRSEQVVSRAAREAKMDRSHLGELLKRHGLKK